MLNMEVKTSLKPSEAAARVKRYFGPGGQGLQISRDEDGCLSFCDSTGYVTASIFQRDHTTVMNLLTQEYEYQVKEFFNHIP